MRNQCNLFAATGAFIMSTILFCSQAPGADPNDEHFGYDNYGAVLKSYVDNAGMVGYKALKADPRKLHAFVAAFAAADPNRYHKWSEKEKIAFWLNAYNALTLKVIIDNYPIKSSFFRSRIYPRNSIRQIAGVWDKITFNVMGKDLTLGHVEHEILRREFDEPGIHMAMVCAAMSCPPLRNEPYLPARLDRQLNDQSRKFLSNSGRLRIDREKGVVHLSPILKWFADDFVSKYAPETNIARHNKKTSAVLNFVAPNLKEADRAYILEGRFRVKYLKYDWSLNEQQITDDKKEAKR